MLGSVRDAAIEAGTSAGKPVDVEGVLHRYGAMTAVDRVTLSVGAGEVLALLGPSGCGKTTLLRIIGGFVRQSAGSVRIDGRLVDDLPPNRRNVGIVFQSYALFPHMSVAENVAYGLKARGWARARVAPRVARMLEVVRLAGFADRLPRQLSGGQQQRVALARALAVGPSVLLLDEPFSALDKGLRLDMQIELKRLQQQFGLTAILVTHDQDEAMSVADRIAVMNRGRVEQCDSPVAVYDRPASLFVSGFVGTSNRLAGRITAVEGAEAGLALDAGGTVVLPAVAGLSGGSRAIMVVRPEQLVLSDREGPGRWPVTRRLSVPLGPDLVHDLETTDGTALKLVERRAGGGPPAGAALWCGLAPGAEPSLFAATDHTGD
ncbi:putative spermidine/putrescine transport system ATP-binding protein [Stella humosa]|uniref:Putative spermidine/putrescine transport system ATP-binding protein n=1 Tax=Stella humosa TaxID=94 RepID=A0A3N1KXM8_9PROT|nr:ABC transporter ATP-binding protein [Stella humosa]ROP83529.1 putative spermidine/putrescine transport system ATP-binding protein [Stella humosa]BBK33198.1 ABC transporter ATP-binding protein [Stella humosa]